MNSKNSGLALTRGVLGVAVAALFAGGGLLSSGTAHAQFGPPMSVFGSISDSAGVIPEGVNVEGYVGNTLCGKGKTQFTGDGDGRVTVYFVNVASREQTANCGSSGAEVRVKVGDRFAPGSVKWDAGPQRFDVTFGSATPAPIPTFTPTPRRTTPGATNTDPANTPTPPARPAGGDTTPPAGTPAIAPGTPTPGATSTTTSTLSPTPTLRGGVSTGSTSGGPGSSGGDGFPVWAAVLAALGGIALVGGGVGFMMARNRHEDEEVEPLTPPAAEL